ncbi:uncharacterized protein (DUF1800 family) [Stella humosa]|uniref:Uncharacterized protein (DUF1800 family) n=1 Tax=Stella humosa TaxID=94 RepID=A0A3N1KVE3_9PROT|nr:DUF1800 domain-containing protein [Stella humosa]ROP83934.1 uncharacterized protein (DUF1800 family) [Stella humosa]BBK33441.1 hypothetical protein STHU_40750 [Stella humosa]
MDSRPIQAAIRFGLGPRPDQPLPADPIAWLDTQIEGADTPPVPAGLTAPPAIADGYRIWLELEAAGQPGPGQANPIEQNFQIEAIAALARRIDTAMPYRERLVEFWANHFTVSKRGGYPVSTVIGPYMREAIRPHVTGRFEDLLLAVFKHPAMLGYLNQASSIGPNSPAGRRSGRGLNENLAREILELHTVSPAAEYTQDDVTAFARLLTGWSYERKKEPFGTVFRQSSHEPGTKMVMGRRFEEGEEATEEALRFLANHASTHRFLATKLARHFIADDPPATVTGRIEGILRDTGGDLRAVAAALPRMPEAWAPPLSKLRSPVDYVTASYRACGASGEAVGRLAFRGCSSLNQPYWTALQPNGWPDRAVDWLGPEPMMQRLDWAYDAAGRITRLEPMMILDTALGPLAPDTTRDAVRRAGSPRDAIAMILASAEFQRR